MKDNIRGGGMEGGGGGGGPVLKHLLSDWLCIYNSVWLNDKVTDKQLII